MRSSTAPTCRVMKSRRRCARSCRPTWCRPFEQLDAIPMIAVRTRLTTSACPKPQMQRFLAAQGYVPPKTNTERLLHDALAEVLRLDRVVGGARLLRRPRRQFDADGALRREAAQEPRHDHRLDARHLHASEHRGSRVSSRSVDRRADRHQGRGVPRPRRRLLPRPARCRRCSCALRAVRPVGARRRLQLGGGRHQRARHAYVAQRRVRGGLVRGADRHLDCREVAAGRPLQGAARSRSGASRTSVSGS